MESNSAECGPSRGEPLAHPPATSAGSLPDPLPEIDDGSRGIVAPGPLSPRLNGCSVAGGATATARRRRAMVPSNRRPARIPSHSAILEPAVQAVSRLAPRPKRKRLR